MVNLKDIARRITEANKVNSKGSTVVLSVTLSMCPNLGYDHGERVTEERLVRAVHEHIERMLMEFPFEDLVDSIEIVEIRNED